MDELDLREFVRKFGKGGQRQLSELGKLQGFVEAINTKIGQELLGGWLRDWSNLFQKIVYKQATDEEKTTFAVIDHQLVESAGKIERYMQLRSGVQNAIAPE